MITKEMLYDPPDFKGDTPIKSTIMFNLIPVQSSESKLVSYKIVRTDVESEEYFLNPGLLSSKEYTGFHTEKG